MPKWKYKYLRGRFAVTHLNVAADTIVAAFKFQSKRFLRTLSPFLSPLINQIIIWWIWRCLDKGINAYPFPVNETLRELQIYIQEGRPSLNSTWLFWDFLLWPETSTRFLGLGLLSSSHVPKDFSVFLHNHKCTYTFPTTLICCGYTNRLVLVSALVREKLLPDGAVITIETQNQSETREWGRVDCSARNGTAVGSPPRFRKHSRRQGRKMMRHRKGCGEEKPCLHYSNQVWSSLQ